MRDKSYRELKKCCHECKYYCYGDGEYVDNYCGYEYPENLGKTSTNIFIDYKKIREHESENSVEPYGICKNFVPDR